MYKLSFTLTNAYQLMRESISCTLLFNLRLGSRRFPHKTVLIRLLVSAEAT